MTEAEQRSEPRTVYVDQRILDELHVIHEAERMAWQTIYIRGLDLMLRRYGRPSVKEITGEDPWRW